MNNQRVLPRLLTVLVASIVALALQASFAVSADAATTSAIEQRYKAEPALAKMLGAPTGVEYSVGSGRVRHYKWGSLYWTSATGVHEVHGAIRNRYHEMGGPSKLGWPTADEKNTYVKYDIPEQRTGGRSEFQKGTLIWSIGTTRAVWVSKPLSDALPYGSYPYWGNPTMDEETYKGVKIVNTGSGFIYGRSTGITQFHEDYPSGVHSLFNTYVRVGAHKGVLGFPVGDSTSITPVNRPEGVVQRFDNGAIYECGYNLVIDDPCELGDAFEVHGAIYYRFKAEGGVDRLGYPTSDEQAAPGGRISHFQNGTIFWDSSTQKTKVTYSK